MANILSTYDNNSAYPLQVHNEEDLLNLNKIAGKRIKWLCDKTDGEGLLVFPKDLKAYGDEIGDNIIFETDGNKLYSNNIMGFIGVGETQLKIGSRFDYGRNDLFMQYMLERVFSINLMNLQYSFNQDSIFDFLLFLFPYFLKKALSQGVYSTYRNFKRNDLKLRGVFDANRHIRLNYPITAAIAYKTREKTYDNEITQLIRHTIEYLRSTRYGHFVINQNEETKECVSQIEEATSTYSHRERTFIINRNLRPRIHPYFSEYEPLRKLCLQILRHDEIKYGSDKDKVYGVIFDGAWLWEEYLATIIQPLGIKHPHNKEHKGGFSLFVNHGAWRYPDFYGKGIVLDAKYKRYGEKEVWEVDREDLAQIISYMYVEKAKMGIVLCPSEYKTPPSIESLRGYGYQMARLSLCISNASTYKEFKQEMSDNERDYAVIINNILETDLSDTKTMPQ